MCVFLSDYFDDNKETRFIHVSKLIASLCDLNTNIFYNTSKIEIDAEMFSSNFAVEHLQQFKLISQ